MNKQDISPSLWMEMVAGQAKGKRVTGHEAGAKVVRTITEFCATIDDIERLTLYAFSTENWKRPRLEVEFLMKLLQKYLDNELGDISCKQYPI